ncbi:hypothetical protein GCM10022226_50970 [Sphaerisporangium flaviroseum]|uniref:Integrase SAM-like N-terminal domain-containing protein n=1 Tax=Sphaerisporangium flaviroseum TaxID=509199 RepID=A0ABP7IQQ1_9ACTN
MPSITEIDTALTDLWGASAPATWNRNRAAIASWLIWCQTKKHWPAPSVPADAERRKGNADETHAVAKTPSTGCCYAATSRSWSTVVRPRDHS